MRKLSFFIFTIALVAAVACNKDNTTPGETVTDLSKNETANCYIVPAAGNYKFKATVKGCSAESVGTPASVEVLWESFGTDVAPSIGDLVQNVALKDGYVQFTATDKKGNAVIAIKDDSNNILWSWHLWLTDNPVEQVYNNNAGTMMDRNLGATSATPGDVHTLGLQYQWGRKDPFLSFAKINCSPYSKQPQAASTLSWPSTEKSSEHLENNNTLSYSISHPTTYLGGYGDWYCTESSYKNDKLWSSDKTMYDPCPAGWRVPDGGANGVWAKAFGSQYFKNGPWDGTNYGMNFGSGNGMSSSMQLGAASTIWYPAAGWREYSSGVLYDDGNGEYYSCTPSSSIGNSNCAELLFINQEGDVYPMDCDNRSASRSVRCIKESSVPVSD